jgi:hypothetical protein
VRHLVTHEDGGALEHDARECDTLALPAGEPHATLADARREACRGQRRGGRGARGRGRHSRVARTEGALEPSAGGGVSNQYALRTRRVPSVLTGIRRVPSVLTGMQSGRGAPSGIPASTASSCATRTASPTAARLAPSAAYSMLYPMSCPAPPRRARARQRPPQRFGRTHAHAACVGACPHERAGAGRRRARRGARLVEDGGLLLDEADLLPKRRGGHGGHVLPVDKNLPALRLQGAREKPRDRRLPASALPDNRHRLPRADLRAQREGRGGARSQRRHPSTRAEQRAFRAGLCANA